MWNGFDDAECVREDVDFEAVHLGRSSRVSCVQYLWICLLSRVCKFGFCDGGECLQRILMLFRFRSGALLVGMYVLFGLLIWVGSCWILIEVIGCRQCGVCVGGRVQRLVCDGNVCPRSETMRFGSFLDGIFRQV